MPTPGLDYSPTPLARPQFILPCRLPSKLLSGNRRFRQLKWSTEILVFLFVYQNYNSQLRLSSFRHVHSLFRKLFSLTKRGTQIIKCKVEQIALSIWRQSEKASLSQRANLLILSPPNYIHAVSKRICLEIIFTESSRLYWTDNQVMICSLIDLLLNLAK